MFKKNALLRAVVAASLTMGLAACGGGSSSSGHQASTETGGDTTVAAGSETGRFVDSAVSGIEYETSAGYTNLTNDNGEFRFNEGDEVTFKLGNLNFGTTQAAALITPVELAGEGDVGGSRAANIARVLQTLDDDGIPGNGITITANTRQAAANQNPTDVADAVLSDPTVADAITGLTSGNTTPQTAVVSAKDANDHLSATLDQLNPLESCSDERAKAVTNDRLIGKAFGFIRSDELGVYHFNDDGTLNDYSYDTERSNLYRDGEVESWELLNGGIAIKFGRDETPMTVCSTENYLLFQEGEDTAKLYDIKPYELPSAAQSFVIGTEDREQKAILTIKADGKLEYFPAETPISPASKGSVNVATGALDLDFDEGGVIDKIYFLAGQSNRIGVYLNYNEEGALANVGTAEMIANASNVSEATLKGSTLISHHEKENETIILRLNNDYTLEDFANDYYQGETQDTRYSQGTWKLNGDELTLIDEPEKSVFQVLDAGTSIYFAQTGTEEEGLYQLSKTKPITETAFLGTYNVNVPTENTINRELVVEENGVCVYSNSECTWKIDGAGKAELDFGGNETGTAHIWQLAGGNDQFAHLITHSDDINDIEPGLMIRK